MQIISEINQDFSEDQENDNDYEIDKILREFYEISIEQRDEVRSMELFALDGQKWQKNILDDYREGDVVKENVEKEESIGNSKQKCIQELETPNDLKLNKEDSDEIPTIQRNLKYTQKFKNFKTTILEGISDLTKKIINDLKKNPKIQEINKEIISKENIQTIIKEYREKRVAIQDRYNDFNQLYLLELLHDIFEKIDQNNLNLTDLEKKILKIINRRN
ncbi:MAG: hypothetical protein ACTSU4_04240 [Promethearchaeota archaeon]